MSSMRDDMTLVSVKELESGKNIICEHDRDWLLVAWV